MGQEKQPDSKTAEHKSTQPCCERPPRLTASPPQQSPALTPPGLGLPPPLNGLTELPKPPGPAGERLQRPAPGKPPRPGRERWGGPTPPAFAVPPREAGPGARPSPHGGGGEAGAGPGQPRDGDGGGGRGGREGRARGRREAGIRRRPGSRSCRRQPLRAALVSDGGSAARARGRLLARETGRPLGAREMEPEEGGRAEGARPLVQSVAGGGAWRGIAYGARGGRGAPVAGRRGLAQRCWACICAAPSLRGSCRPASGCLCGVARAPGA